MKYPSFTGDMGHESTKLPRPFPPSHLGANESQNIKLNIKIRNHSRSIFFLEKYV